MKLSPVFLKQVESASEVAPGNVYPAKGGKGDTEYWLVVSLTKNGCNLIGFDKEGNPCSTASYLKGAMRERPLIGKANLDNLVLEAMK